MKKEQLVILKDRGIISVSGEDATDFLQNILSNNVNNVNENKSIYSAIFTPQGKYLYEFFVIKSNDGFLLDCDEEFTQEIIKHLARYKLRSKVKIKNLSEKYVVGIINLEKFNEILAGEKNNRKSILYRESALFIDPRKKQLGARLLSTLEKIHLTIKKLNLKLTDSKYYLEKAYTFGIPTKGTRYLQNQLFGLEANLEEHNAIDFKKGCYVGQENTARMKLKNKIRKKLMPVQANQNLSIGSEITFKNKVIGKILIAKPYPFALIKLNDPNLDVFINEDLFIDDNKIRIIKINYN